MTNEPTVTQCLTGSWFCSACRRNLFTHLTVQTAEVIILSSPPSPYPRLRPQIERGMSQGSQCFILGTVSVSVETNLHPMYRPMDIRPMKTLFVVVCPWLCHVLREIVQIILARSPGLPGLRARPVSMSFSVSHPGGGGDHRHVQTPTTKVFELADIHTDVQSAADSSVGSLRVLVPTYQRPTRGR